MRDGIVHYVAAQPREAGQTDQRVTRASLVLPIRYATFKATTSAFLNRERRTTRRPTGTRYVLRKKI
jgi:hypothetical protein